MVIKEKTCKETKDVLKVNRKWTVVLEGQNVTVGKGGPFITRDTQRISGSQTFLSILDLRVTSEKASLHKANLIHQRCTLGCVGLKDLSMHRSSPLLPTGVFNGLKGVKWSGSSHKAGK